LVGGATNCTKMGTMSENKHLIGDEKRTSSAKWREVFRVAV